MRASAPLILAATLLLPLGVAWAKPPYKQALADYYGSLLPARLADCGACHADRPDERRLNADLPRPHNPFGARLHAVTEELRKAGRKTDLASRLAAVAREDADGDGVANEAELLLGRRPGAPRDRPSAADLKGLPKLQAALAKRHSAYAWRPLDAVKAPPVPPAPPGWGRNPVDAFVAAEHRRRGLQPRPEAPRPVLLRRLYLDLIGLPPTREELHAFLADRSPDAYEKVVDRLLADPRHGERWARHWMDVWRYSDWDGYGNEVRNSQPHIWRWRDWIVDSLNADKGYDRMVREMLAGDELAPDDPAVLPATGFLVRNWHKFSRHETLTRLIEGTGKAFLGLTLNCARCHDSKYDPISQEEYFGFRAFFEPYDIRTDRVGGELDTGKDGIARAYDAHPQAETFFLIQGDDRKPDKTRPARAALPAALGGPALEIRPVELPSTAHIPDKQAHVIEAQLRAARSRVAQAQKSLENGPPDDLLLRLQAEAARGALETLEATLAAERLEDAGARAEDHPRHSEWQSAARVAGLAQRREALAAAVVVREEARRQVTRLEAAQPPQPEPLAKAREALAKAEAAVTTAEAEAAKPPTATYRPRYSVSYPATSTGRRLALANWITDRRNPLAARVAVNHLWLRHFGKALVPSVFDFGGNGRLPSHPELLDWLSAHFMDEGWSMKKLHRLLVTSATYRQDSTYDAVAAAKDPDNRALWRMNARRMEAEAVRDAILYASGQLDEIRGGPELDQNLGLTAKRRSLYFRHSVEKQVEFLATFDQASVTECYERAETIVPQQALALANSRLSVAASRVLAGRLWRDVAAESDDAARQGAFLTMAFERLLGRPPSAAERSECLTFLADQARRLANPGALSAFDTGPAAATPPAADPAQRARESLIHVLLNHHDFVNIR